MKLIDLLVKNAKGEEVPKRIKVFGKEFEFLYQSGDKTYFDNDGDYLFSDVYDWENILNDEVEIVEEKPKKIEKISVKTNNHNVRKVANKINEIIDYLLEKESDK